MKKSESKKALAGKSPASCKTELDALLQGAVRPAHAGGHAAAHRTRRSCKDVRRGIARVRTLMHRRQGQA